MPELIEQQLASALTGRYAIDRQIGAGGMATVYLARDLKHDRRVALKVLKPDLAVVLGADRFLGEIRVTANLQHPNLLPLFDSGAADGLLYYVMPYVEGESLRAKLQREKQLPIDQTIHIAAAVASALDYAHRHGVIHRDLKPENILLHEGEPLVADFGIALAVTNAGGARITQTGVSLGTPQYMSPEQATGDRDIDGRTDVYSLGAVTYEMLTGDPPHTASTAQAVIAKVITDVPRSARITRPTIPEHVAKAIDRALEKLPADRWTTAHDFAEALQGRHVAIPPGAWRPGLLLPTRRASWWRGTRVILGVLAVVAVSVAVWSALVSRTRASSISFVVDPPVTNGAADHIVDAAISPDGGTIAFVARSDAASSVYVRGLQDLDARPIPGIVDAARIAFSPDGRLLSVLTLELQTRFGGKLSVGGRLLSVPLDGRSPVELVKGTNFWYGTAWSDNETIVIGGRSHPGSDQTGLARISARGGPVLPLTKPTPGWDHARPVLSNDGRTMLFMDYGPGFTEDDFLAIGSAATGRFAPTGSMAVQPVGLVDDHALYLALSGAIMSVPFDAESFKLTGAAKLVMQAGGTTDNWPDLPIAALSRNGTLIYRRGDHTERLAIVDSAGVAHRLSDEERNFGAGNGLRPSASPDGRRIAITVVAPRGDTLTSDIWTFDIAARMFTRVTTMGSVVNADWTPDGKQLVFGTWLAARPALWLQLADGREPAERLINFPAGTQISPEAWSVTPDGRGVLYCQSSHDAFELWYLPLVGARTPERLDLGPFGNGCTAKLSPDGRWVAYVASDGERLNVYLRPFRAPGSVVQVSVAGGDTPVWSHDGRHLYYRIGPATGSANGSLVVARLGVRNNSLRVLDRKTLFPLGLGGVFDIMADGRVLMVQEGDRRSQLVVTTNWLSQMRERWR